MRTWLMIVNDFGACVKTTKAEPNQYKEDKHKENATWSLMQLIKLSGIGSSFFFLFSNSSKKYYAG